MKDNLNWDFFSDTYHLKNDKYVQDVALLQRLKSTDRYPVILYPQLLCEQISKKFMIGSYGVGKDKSHIFLHDFLNVAKQLNLKGNDWHFFNHPANPKYATVPKMPNIPTEKLEYYKSRNWGCLIPVLIMALPPFLISLDDPAMGKAISVFWIPFVLFLAYKLRVGRSEDDARIRKLKKHEIDKLKEEALQKYEDDFEAYRKLIAEYDDKKREFDQRLESQAKLLDIYSKFIVESMFERCMITYPKIQINNNPPQQGASENNLFYALMKKFPSHIKIDRALGAYSPDLVLSNGRSCPIDIEVDEPYEFKTKKEIHYIGCGDEERNQFFVQNDWFVLRFSENQIKNHLTECVNIVEALVDFIKWGKTSKLYKVERIIANIQEPRWTKEQSRMFAIENYRLKQ